MLRHWEIHELSKMAIHHDISVACPGIAEWRGGGVVIWVPQAPLSRGVRGLGLGL